VAYYNRKGWEGKKRTIVGGRRGGKRSGSFPALKSGKEKTRQKEREKQKEEGSYIFWQGRRVFGNQQSERGHGLPTSRSKDTKSRAGATNEENKKGKGNQG